MKCPSWYDVFEREIEKADPDIAGICGLMTKDGIELAKKYVALKNQLVEDYGLDQDFIRANLSMSAIINLVKFSPASDIRKKATEKIAQALKMERRLTKRDVDTIIGYVPKQPAHPAIKPAEIRLPCNPAITLINAPTNKRSEIALQFCKVAGNSIGVYEELAKKNNLEDEYAAFIVGVGIIRKYLDGKLVEKE